MTVDTVLRNGKIVTPDGIFEGGLAIESGKIVAVAKNPALPPSAKTIDVEGCFILPGFIDAHCHCHGMQRSDWEDFTTGTKAAAASGITTILEMPITVPPTSTGKSFTEKREVVERDALVNSGIYGGAGSQNVGEVLKMAKEGAIAFKTFMHPPPPGREQDFWGLYITDDGSFLEVLETVAETALVSCVHAENAQVAAHLTSRLQMTGRNDLSAFLESRPGVVEAEGAHRAAVLASEAGARAHICHVCAREAVKAVGQLKQNGLPLTAETCPHYLTFTHEEIQHLGPYAKINPPIRHSEDRDVLWKALREGTIDIIASDHSPFTKDLKEVGHENIWKASMGAPNLDAMTPVMLTHVNRGLISLQELVKVLSENVARIFGLYPRKGVLNVGSDADVVVVDLNKKKRLNAQSFYTKARDISLLYDGFEAEGIPSLTIVNGVEVMRNGEVTGKPGTGRFVRPKGLHK